MKGEIKPRPSPSASHTPARLIGGDSLRLLKYIPRSIPSETFPYYLFFVSSRTQLFSHDLPEDLYPKP